MVAAKAAGKPVFLTPADPEEARALAENGASGFILPSDQGFLRQAAAAALSEMSTALGDDNWRST